MSAAYPRYSYIISKYVFFFFFPASISSLLPTQTSPPLPSILFMYILHTHTETHETDSIKKKPTPTLHLLSPPPLSPHGLKIKLKKFFFFLRRLDPIFALTIGLAAATIRIQREERRVGRDGDLIAVWGKGLGMIRRKGEKILWL